MKIGVDVNLEILRGCNFLNLTKSKKAILSMISYSTNSDTKPSYQSNFILQKLSSFADFFEVILHRVWSPIIWEYGKRARANYIGCKYIVLDFDTGDMTLDKAIEECKSLELWHIIGTTKSHQKDKRTASGLVIPGCDRFRLILKGKGFEKDREKYEYNMKVFTNFWPCDASCVDGARFFFPCTKIVSHSSGKALPWLDIDADYVREEQRFEKHYQKLMMLGKLGMVPEWMQSIFNGTKIMEGERHKTCYKLGATWKHLGYDLKALEERVSKTNLKDIGQMDMLRALSNGYNSNIKISKNI